MLKSGSEFREFSVLTVQEGRGTSRPEVKVQHCKITKEVTPDESMDAIVEEYLGKVCTCVMCHQQWRQQWYRPLH